MQSELRDFQGTSLYRVFLEWAIQFADENTEFSVYEGAEIYIDEYNSIELSRVDLKYPSISINFNREKPNDASGILVYIDNLHRIRQICRGRIHYSDAHDKNLLIEPREGGIEVRGADFTIDQIADIVDAAMSGHLKFDVRYLSGYVSCINAVFFTRNGPVTLTRKHGEAEFIFRILKFFSRKKHVDVEINYSGYGGNRTSLRSMLVLNGLI